MYPSFLSFSWGDVLRECWKTEAVVGECLWLSEEPEYRLDVKSSVRSPRGQGQGYQPPAATICITIFVRGLRSLGPFGPPEGTALVMRFAVRFSGTRGPCVYLNPSKTIHVNLAVAYFLLFHVLKMQIKMVEINRKRVLY